MRCVFLWIGILACGMLAAESHLKDVRPQEEKGAWVRLRKAAEPFLQGETLSDSEAPEQVTRAVAARFPEWKDLEGVSEWETFSPGVADRLLSGDLEKKLPPEVFGAICQACAERLIQDEGYDVALRLLEKVPVSESVRPQTLLFFRAVAEYQLLLKIPFENTLKELAGYEDRLPKRYAVLVGFMREDFKTLNEKGLDHVSRRMKDVRRRLDLGQTDEPVQKIEEGILQSLDETIQKMEEEQKKRQKRQMSSAPVPGGKPLDEARLMGGKGPGEVEKRKHDHRSGWGNLPPKEREESLQQIGTDFPPHYRDVIEQYFKRMAE